MDKQQSDWQKGEDALRQGVVFVIMRVLGLALVGAMMILAMYRVVVFFNESNDPQISVPAGQW